MLVTEDSSAARDHVEDLLGQLAGILAEGITDGPFRGLRAAPPRPAGTGRKGAHGHS